MATPIQHAKCSASSSGRWLNCTAAPTYEAQFPDGDPGDYAKEGTLAHKICELHAEFQAKEISKRTFNARMKKCREDPLFQEEMIKTAEVYCNYILQKIVSFPGAPYQKQEVRVDFSDYVPEGFGTSDCLIIGNNSLIVVDYKHGKGVQVSAENNSQMRLYALGGLKQYGMFYPVKTITMAIVQPRITEEISEETITTEELLAWGESIKPAAQAAFSGEGAEFKEGPWCQFCKGKAVCRARAANMTAFEDFKDLPIAGKMTDDEKRLRGQAIVAGFDMPVLTDEEIGGLLHRAEGLVSWYNDLKAYALDAILSGKDIPGWKAVAGRSVRAFDDTDAAFAEILKAGYEEAMLYERKPKSLAELEKMIGKKDFAEIVGSHIVKPVGKPTLTDSADKREAYSPAAADFAGVKT